VGHYHFFIFINIYIRRIRLEIFGIFGFILAGFCYYRIDALEKKLKEADVLDRDFDSKNEARK
jgi:hypothetical protein